MATIALLRVLPMSPLTSESIVVIPHGKLES